MVVVKKEKADYFEEASEYEKQLNMFSLRTQDSSTLFTDNLSCDSMIRNVIGELESLNEANLESNDAMTPDVPAPLPERSIQKYQLAFSRFERWCEDHKFGVTDVNENVMMEYFQEKSVEFKASTLWSMYSMIRAVLHTQYSIDISKCTNLLAFLKRRAEGYTAKKSKVFTKEQITKFLLEADEKKYLFMKVALIVGISGACRRDEMVSLLVHDVKDEEHFYEVAIKQTNNQAYRHFLVTPGNIKGINLVNVVRKYALMRPPNVGHQRFFIQYLNGRCTKQPIGINTFGAVPKRIAEFLELPNPEEYTGHCFRRSSATLVADSVADLLTIKRHGGWKITSVSRRIGDET